MFVRKTNASETASNFHPDREWKRDACAFALTWYSSTTIQTPEKLLTESK